VEFFDFGPGRDGDGGCEKVREGIEFQKEKKGRSREATRASKGLDPLEGEGCVKKKLQGWRRIVDRKMRGDECLGEECAWKYIYRERVAFGQKKNRNPTPEARNYDQKNTRRTPRKQKKGGGKPSRSGDSGRGDGAMVKKRIPLSGGLKKVGGFGES